MLGKNSNNLTSWVYKFTGKKVKEKAKLIFRKGHFVIDFGRSIPTRRQRSTEHSLGHHTAGLCRTLLNVSVW